MNLSHIKSTITTMPIDDFISIEDCRRQRDTVKHAKKAKREHLRHASPVQRHVNIAQMADGKQYKLDGHTRAYLWERNELERIDDTVSVTVYHTSNLEEVAELYTHFDASTSSENAEDQLAGTMRELEWEPVSPFFRACKFNNMLFVAESVVFNNGRDASFSGGINRANRRRELLKEFLPELIATDALHVAYTGIKSTRINGAIVAAMIVSHRAVAGKQVPMTQEMWRDFWVGYINDGGKKNGRERDAIQALTDYVSKNGSGRGMPGAIDVCNKGLSALLGYRMGKTYIKELTTTKLDCFRKTNK